MRISRWGVVLVVALMFIAATGVRAAEPAASGVKLSLAEGGIVITAGPAGSFTMKYPLLEGLDPKEPSDRQIHSPTHATLTYATGIKADVRVEGGEVTIAFSGIAQPIRKMRQEMHVPFTMSQGGRFAIGGDAPVPFPEEKPASPFLYQGSAGSISFYHPTGPAFTIALPKGCFQQLQDNREWNWSIFAWWYSVPFPSGKSARFVIRISEPADGAGREVKPLIDRFGQWIDRDFPGKVTSEEDLASDLAADEAYYASLNPPARDAYGGFPGTGEKYGLQKTGFFHLGKIGDADVLVTPEGNAFFQLGVCCITPIDEYTLVAGREEIFEWLPSADDPKFKTAWRPNDRGVFSFHLANVIRKTGKPFDLGEYVATWIERERKWGFNSTGAFVPTGPGPARDQLIAKNYPYVATLPLGNLPRIEGANQVWDPFTEDIEKRIDALFAEPLKREADNPLIIGYFIANEPSVEDVPKVVPRLKASKSGSKRRLIERLREKYGQVAAFNRAWGVDVESFEQAGETPLSVSTAEAAQDMREFFEEFLDRRYRLVHEHLRKYDTNHLLLGDRWMPGTANNEQLIRAAGKYLDVVSINYYTYSLDRRFLDRIREWSGNKPILLSEFYFSSPAESGLVGGLRMETQRDRGLAYRHYVEQAASLGYVVGIQWFLNMDQAATGRFFQKFNGEAANTGLVNVADRPYKDFLAEVMKTNYDVLAVITGEREPFQLDDPRFRSQGGQGKKTVAIHRMVNPFQLDGVRSEWPAVPPYRIEPVGDDPFEATFRAAWDDQYLYLYVEVSDPTPMRNAQDASRIWNGDAVEIFIGTEDFEQGGTMIYSDRQVLIRGAPAEGREPVYYINAPKQYEARTIVVPALDGKGYVVEAAIPFEALGFTPRQHQELMFDLAIDDASDGPRERQYVFNGTKLASKDRGVWGRAQLLP